MGRKEDADVAKVFLLVGRGMDLRAAWVKCDEPTTWGNVQRRYKERLRATEQPAAAAAPPSGGGSKRAQQLLAAAGAAFAV